MLQRMKRLAFAGLSKLLVGLTGHGYDRSPATNDLHHKLSFRLFKLAPRFGIASEERIHFAAPIPFSLSYDARDGGVGHKFLMYREYEPNMTRVVNALIKPGMSIWNIGANLGYYTVLAARLSRGGRVTAFEPHPQNASRLRHNVRMNGLSNATVVEAALAAEGGSLTFYESESNTGDHRITAEGDRRGITVSALDASQAIEEYGSPQVIIMDVQGAEGVILRSLAPAMTASHPVLIFEFWPDGLASSGSSAQEVEDLLHALEYQVWRIDEYRSMLLRVEPGRIGRGMKAGEETNLLALPKGYALPAAIAKSWR
ncbi:MAG TPA: FkbM family methyltransferase [Candidatus Kapabacteria bacterium]|jgi:FkbM family methyltransferase|nr:FkbM family methyltransferase [Candidatus Kapabacteria bacterium]